MKNRSILILGILLLAATAVAQEHRGVSLELTVSNGAGRDQVLVVGAREGATSDLDPLMEEAELPPPPPNEIFDARCVSTPGKSSLGLGSLTDYRAWPSSGGVFSETYTVAYQAGISASSVTMSWRDPLPGRVTKLVIDGEDQAGKTSVQTQFAQGQLTVEVSYDPSPLTFEASPNPVLFTVNNRDPLPEQSLTITPRGDPLAQWELDTDADWIDILPSSGEGAMTVNVAVNTQVLPAGTYEGVIYVRSPVYPARLDIPVRMEMTVGVHDVPAPGALWLGQNYPNPFNPMTVVDVRLGTIVAGAAPSLILSDVLGRDVRDLSPALSLQDAVQTLRIDASDLPGGMYTLTLRYGGSVMSRNMLLVK